MRNFPCIQSRTLRLWAAIGVGGLIPRMGTKMEQNTLGTLIPERIGRTPLVRLEKVARGLEGVTILGKAEWTNPGGSVKDRAAASMVRDAQKRGLLGPGKTLLDATSGNTGIAFAMLGAAMGFPVTLAMPRMFRRSGSAFCTPTERRWSGRIRIGDRMGRSAGAGDGGE